MSAPSYGGWRFAGFPLLIVVLFVVGPSLLGVILSVFEWNGGGAPRFVGLSNWRAALDDVQLGYAFRNTLVFAIVTVPITIVGGFLCAVALDAEWFKGAAIVRTVLLVPTVISIVAIGFVWRWVLDPQSGLLSLFASGVGIDELPPFLGDSPWALAAIALIHVWRQLGFATVLYLAALARAPRSQREAAGLDGAGSFRATLHVTWPAVRPMTTFLCITGAIWALQIFDLVWIVTGGAPQRWTDVLNVHLFREFSANRLGYAATLGTVLLALSAVVAFVQLQLAARREVTR